jgi:glucosyl-dolichyl phosphate glucuronosyltransferase
LFEAHPPGWLQRWWERPVYKGRALPYLSILDFGEGRHPIDPAYVWGCNFSIRRDVLLAAGGFHPDALPRTHLRYRGDGETHVSEFVRRTHGDALFDSRASVEHRVTKARMSCEYMVQRAYAQGISDSYTAIRRSKGSRPWIQRLGVACKQQVRRVFHRMASVLAWTDDSRRDLESILAHTAIAYLRGYTFHGAQVRKDPELLAWVLKPDYLA